MKKILNYFKDKFRRLELTTVAWCILYSANSVFVQQAPVDLVKTHNIKFPIVELGNCANYSECRSYCEDPLNQTACAQYAAKKGFYEAPATEKTQEAIVETAKKELGCSSHEACNAFCSQKENFEKCSNFAQRNKLAGGYHVDPGAQKILDKAKAVIGCSSYETCKTYCEQEVNAEICTSFARSVGIRGGVETTAPSSNSSEELSAPIVSLSPSTTIYPTIYVTGYPTWYPSPSPNLTPSPTSAYFYITGAPTTAPFPTPTLTPSYCHEPSGGCGANYYWDSVSCSCKYYSPTTASTPTPAPSPTPSSSTTATPYPTFSSSDAETMCKQTPGCTWTNNTCQCTHGVSAQELTPEKAKEHNISFPIPELGNCNSCGECNNFCANPKNQETCLAFSKKTGLYEEEQKQQTVIYEKAKTELGCDSEESCRLYCQKEENFDKCKIFAAKNDIIDTATILNLTSGQTVSKTEKIELKAPKATKIEVMLQPLDSIADTIYVGRTNFKGDLTTQDFTWDSTNTPNGEYNLIATAYKPDGTTSSIGPIRVKVDNAPLAGGVEITTKDIALASQFDPEKVPVDKSATAINKIENTKTENNQTAVVLEGKATANSIVTVLVYSNPIVVTVKTDANGLWKYTLEKPLDSGKHIAYVVTSRSDGSKIRSEASTFLIPPAIAASKNENLSLESASEFNSIQTFIYVTISIIGVAVLGVIILYKLKSRNSPTL